MADNEIRFLGDLQRLELKPGDVFVLTVDGAITRDAHDRIQAIWAGIFEEDPRPTPKLLVLESGMKLGAIAPAPPE